VKSSAVLRDEPEKEAYRMPALENLRGGSCGKRVRVTLDDGVELIGMSNSNARWQQAAQWHPWLYKWQIFTD
jgi:hypothetical protein